MYPFINEYKQSCLLVKKRIKFLTEQRRRFNKKIKEITVKSY